MSAALKTLVLLRGLPGSGKTTLAQALKHASACPIFSVDDYFTDPETGRYFFKYQENHLAYKACEQNTRKALEEAVPLVVVHNTFTLDWELEPYFQMARECDYQLHVVTVENYHGNANVHEVAEDQLARMAAKYQVKLLF